MIANPYCLSLRRNVPAGDNRSAVGLEPAKVESSRQMKSKKKLQTVCLVRSKIKFSHVMQTVEQLAAASSSVHLLLLEPAVCHWDLADNRWLERLKKLPVSVHTDSPRCSMSDVVTGIDLEKVITLIRNADIVVPM